MSEFDKGYACAVAFFAKVDGPEVRQREALEANGLTSIKKLRDSGVDAYDIEALKPLIKEIEARRSPPEPVRTHKLVKLTPKGAFARDCVRNYGSILRQYQESPNTLWFTCPTEEDPYNFKHWGFSLDKNECTIEEIKV